MNSKTRYLRNSKSKVRSSNTAYKSKQPRIFNFRVCAFALLYLLTGCETILASIEVGRAVSSMHPTHIICLDFWGALHTAYSS